MDRYNFALGVLCLCLTLLSTSADDSCDKSKCPGPIVYYEDLGCKPVYKAPDNCCPYKYNCDHLKTRSSDKCYANGNEYAIGESLKEEDANPCDIACTCRKHRDVAQFNCAIVDCPYHRPPNPDCYLARNVSQCCPGPLICSEKPEDRATCEVDGKIYKDGEEFVSKSEPNKRCFCGPGYKGKNIEPFCRVVPAVPTCRTEFYHADDIKNNCTPTYYYSQSPQKDCSVAYRCQNDRDEVIKQNRDANPPQADDDMVCQFGTLLMRHGDELNQATHYVSVCIRCVCEVGPVPTCQRLSDEECDVTKHPAFDNLK